MDDFMRYVILNTTPYVCTVGPIAIFLGVLALVTSLVLVIASEIAPSPATIRKLNFLYILTDVGIAVAGLLILIPICIYTVKYLI